MLASPDDVASQVLWRSVQAKLSARNGEHERAQVAIAGALELINRSDWLDWQGKSYLDLAEVCRLPRPCACGHCRQVFP